MQKEYPIILNYIDDTGKYNIFIPDFDMVVQNVYYSDFALNAPDEIAFHIEKLYESDKKIPAPYSAKFDKKKDDLELSVIVELPEYDESDFYIGEPLSEQEDNLDNKKSRGLQLFQKIVEKILSYFEKVKNDDFEYRTITYYSYGRPVKTKRVRVDSFGAKLKNAIKLLFYIAVVVISFRLLFF